MQRSGCLFTSLRCCHSHSQQSSRVGAVVRARRRSLLLLWLQRSTSTSSSSTSSSPASATPNGNSTIIARNPNYFNVSRASCVRCFSCVVSSHSSLEGNNSIANGTTITNDDNDNDDGNQHSSGSLEVKENNETLSSVSECECEHTAATTTTTATTSKLGKGSDDSLWWETAHALLETREFEIFLQNDNNCTSTTLEQPLNTLQRLCLERPGTRQTSELVHRCLERIRQLLQTHHHTIGRTHYHTAQSKRNNNNNNTNNNRTALLASMVHQTMVQIVQHPRNLWKPNSTITFQILMRLAQLAQNPMAAQSWLEYQWRASRNQSRRHNVQAPNRQDYTAVVEAWARSSLLPEAPQHCALLVRQLQQRYAQGKEPSLQPTEAAYVAWIMAITATPRFHHKNNNNNNNQNNNDNNPRAAAMAAQQVLKEMWDRVELDHFIPSATIYNVVISAWAKAGDPPQAEAVLREQCEMALQHDYCRPNATSFAAVLSAYARSENESAPERAEALVALQCRYASQMATAEERDRVLPNVVTYTTVLDCWAKSNRHDAPLRAQAILQQMNEQVAGDDNDADNNNNNNNNIVTPNTLSYNAVLNAWARSGRPEAVERVEELWQEMQARQIPADAVTYMTRINVWERHRGPDMLPRTAARRAAQVLHEMIEQSHIPPTTLHFNRVILAWTQCGDALRAEALLEVMISHWLRGGGGNGANSFATTNTAAVPNLSSFNFVLSAWSKKSSPAGAAQAEALLDRMEEYSSTLLSGGGGSGDDSSKTGDGAPTLRLPVRPDVVSFNTTIASWARAGDDCDVAWERAMALKRRMEGPPHRLQPDIYTYGSLLQIVARNQHMASRERATHANQLLVEMQDSGVQPNGFIMRLVDQCTAVRRGDSG